MSRIICPKFGIALFSEYIKKLKLLQSFKVIRIIDFQFAREKSTSVKEGGVSWKSKFTAIPIYK